MVKKNWTAIIFQSALIISTIVAMVAGNLYRETLLKVFYIEFAVGSLLYLFEVRPRRSKNNAQNRCNG